MDENPVAVSYLNEPRRGWWSRNWKWAVPIVIILPLLACGTCAIGVFFAAFATLKNHEVTKVALERARAHEQVVALLGEPIETGYLVTGQINDEGQSGNAQLTIPISGPKSGASLEVQATKSTGTWAYTRIVVVPQQQGGQPIDLLVNGS